MMAAVIPIHVAPRARKLRELLEELSALLEYVDADDVTIHEITHERVAFSVPCIDGRDRIEVEIRKVEDT